MIQYLIANGQYRKAGLKIANLVSGNHQDTQSNRLKSNVLRLSPALMSARKQSIHQAMEHFLNLIIDPSADNEVLSDAVSCAELRVKREKFIDEFLPVAEISPQLSQKVKWAHQNAVNILSCYRRLILCINSGHYQCLDFSLESAHVLSEGLSLGTKAQLSKAIQSIFDTLDEGDVLYYAAMAFIRLVYQDYPNSANRAQDERVIVAFQDIRNVYPAMARHLHDALIKHLEQDSSISDLSLYGPYAGSHQKALLEHLSEGRLQALRTALIARFDRMLSAPVTNLQQCRQTWMQHGKMFQMILKLSGTNGHSATVQVSKLERLAQKKLNTFLFPMSAVKNLGDIDLTKAHREKKEVINSILFAKNLGAHSLKKQLSVAISHLLSLQRKAMMGLRAEPSVEQFITLSYDFIMVGGTPEQAQHSDNLVQAWHIYASDLACLVAKGERTSTLHCQHAQDVKRQALCDALDDYIGQLDARILGYFSHQFALENAFIGKITILRQLLTDGGSIESAQIDEQVLCELLRNHQKTVRWHWHVPSIHDAEQLLIGLHISVKAHQWVEHYKAQLLQSQVELEDNPMHLCDILKTLAIDMMQKFGMGHGRFTTQLASAIGAANDYFVPCVNFSAKNGQGHSNKDQFIA